MPCSNEFHRSVGQYLKYFLMLVTCLWLARCLQLSCNLLAMQKRVKMATEKLGLGCCDLPGGFHPQHSCLTLHTLTPFCVEMLEEQLSELFTCPVHSAGICTTTATVLNGSDWAFFCHMAQGMLGNASALGLSLYFRAGSTAQVLNNTFIRPFK